MLLQPIVIFVFTIMFSFICGYRGNEWAWRKGNHTNTETFLKVQQTWNRAGIFSLIMCIIILILLIVIIVSCLSYLSNFSQTLGIHNQLGIRNQLV